MIKSALPVCGLVLMLAGCSPGGNPESGSVQAQATRFEELDTAKMVARRWFDEVINERNLDAINDIYAEEYVHHGPGGADMRGLDTVREFAASILAASNDRHAKVKHQVAENDLVVTHFVSSGHQTGQFRGMPASGQLWITEGIVISRLEDGKIVEDWEIVHHSDL